MKSQIVSIVMADDDPDDCLMAQEALLDARVENTFHQVADGEQLMDYLRQRGAFSEPGCAPPPGLILLDLNMPKKNGFECLEEIKSDPQLRRIPVIVLTTSRGEEDILRSYDLGVAGFVNKPVTFEGLVKTMRGIGDYWLRIVRLPL